jgi:hypothetical protein
MLFTSAVAVLNRHQFLNVWVISQTCGGAVSLSILLAKFMGYNVALF